MIISLLHLQVIICITNTIVSFTHFNSHNQKFISLPICQEKKFVHSLPALLWSPLCISLWNFMSSSLNISTSSPSRSFSLGCCWFLVLSFSVQGKENGRQGCQVTTKEAQKAHLFFSIGRPNSPLNLWVERMFWGVGASKSWFKSNLNEIFFFCCCFIQ